MRVDGNMPVATSNNAQEKVSEKSSGSDFNNVLKSSVKSKSNNSLKKSSTYSDDNKLSKDNPKTISNTLNNNANDQIEKCRSIAGDGGEKANISTDDIKKNIYNNTKENIKASVNSKSDKKVVFVDDNYYITNDLPITKETQNSKDDNKLVSIEEDVINKIKDKSDKLDADCIISVLNQITAIINSKAENIEYSESNDNLLGQINSILDNKIAESQDSILSFFKTMGKSSSSMEDVLKNLNNVLSNNNVQLSQDDKKGILSILQSLEKKITEDAAINYYDAKNILDSSKVNNVDSLNALLSKESNTLNNSTNVKGDNLEVLENLQTSIENKNTEVLNTNKELINQIKKLLNENEQVSNNGSAQNIINKDSVKVDENVEMQNSNLSNNDSADDLKGNKDEQILKSILNGKDESNTINKATAFAGTFNNTNAIDGTKEVSKLVKAQHLAEDILESVKYMETNNIKQLTVKINPRNLGELSIKILQEDGILKAQIKASTKDAYDILSRNVSIINKELSNHDLKIQNVNISLNDDTTFFKGSSFESNTNNFRNNESQNSNNAKNINYLKDDDEALEDNDSQILNNINMLA